MGRYLLIAVSLYVIAWLAVDRAYAVPITAFVDGRTNLYLASPTGSENGLVPLGVGLAHGNRGTLTF